jgi:hypothetical protein
MNSEYAAELPQWVERITAAWRAGDAGTVLSLMSSDPNVTMSGPLAAAPAAIGPLAVTDMVRRLVQPLPAGSGVFPKKTVGYRNGDFAWANCDAVLRRPGQPELGWFMVFVLRREAGVWKFLHFGAFQGAALG